MKTKWMVGALSMAIVVGGAIGVSTMGTGLANDMPNSNTSTNSTSHFTPRDSFTSSPEQQTAALVQNQNQQPTSEQKPLLKAEQAIAIALKEADGYVESVELERDRGKIYYEIEVKNSTKEYDIYVEAYTGEVLRVKEERDRNGHKVERMKDAITMEEAISIANERFPGTVTQSDLDSDDGQLYYEIEIRSGRDEVEIEIDAYTGEIISVDYDD